MSDEIEEAKKKISLLNYIGGYPKSYQGGKLYRYKYCPKCSIGKYFPFVVYPNTNSYYSWNQCCNGGDIVNYMQEIEGLSRSEAVKKLLEMSGPVIYVQKEKPLEYDLNKFYDSLTKKYKFWENRLEKTIDKKEKLICNLNLTFYENIIDKIIYKEYKTLDEIKDIEINLLKLHEIKVSNVYISLKKYYENYKNL